MNPVTPDRMSEFSACVDRHLAEPGPLIPCLHDAQRVFGCIPVEIQEYIAARLGETKAKVNGVVTFYARFAEAPRGRYEIGVCLGTACYVKGAGRILERVCRELDTEYGATSADGKFSVVPTRCVGNCADAPVVVIDGRQFGNMTPDLVMREIGGLDG